jgi:hypothetical protein
MVLLEIDAQSIAILEFECDAPWSIDVNRIARRLATKDMKIETGDVHVCGATCAIKGVQAAPATLVQCAMDARCRPRLE